MDKFLAVIKIAEKLNKYLHGFKTSGDWFFAGSAGGEFARNAPSLLYQDSVEVYMR
jgi:hypothetical protein